MCCDMHVHWSLMYSAKWKTVPWCSSSGVFSVCNRWANRLPQSYGFAPSAKLHHMHTFCSQLTVLRLSWRWLSVDSNTLLTSGIGEVPSMQTSICASRTVFATFEWFSCRCKAAGYETSIKWLLGLTLNTQNCGFEFHNHNCHSLIKCFLDVRYQFIHWPVNI